MNLRKRKSGGFERKKGLEMGSGKYKRELSKKGLEGGETSKYMKYQISILRYIKSTFI